MMTLQARTIQPDVEHEAPANRTSVAGERASDPTPGRTLELVSATASDPARERAHKAGRFARMVFAVLGCVLVGIGIIGVVLPVLPTTPFMLLAAACFARGSKRLHAWLLGSRVFGPTIRAWRRTRSIPLRAKIAAILLIVIVLGSTIVLLVTSLMLQIILATIGAAVSVWLLCLPTRRDVHVGEPHSEQMDEAPIG